jgi:uncharacterized membrane protein HdeD (DUF308 family)
MSIFSAAPAALDHEANPRSWWLYLLLGIALIIGGIIVLGDVVLASVISALIIAWTVVILGVLEVVHAFGARGWKGFLLDLLVGLLYIAAGGILISNPVAASLTLTLALGIVLIVSGIFRMVLAGALWEESGWAILVSGLIAVLAGAIIVARWPASGLWVLGLLLGIDLLIHGFAWIAYSLSVRSKPVPQVG